MYVDDDWGLVMSGGHIGTEVGKTVEITVDGVSSELIQDLPEGVANHCLKIIDSNTLFLTAGGPLQDDNPVGNEYVSLNNLTVDKFMKMSCSSFS